jgi:hypothetical protein
MLLRLEQPLAAEPELVLARLRDPLSYRANPRVRGLRPWRDGFRCLEQVAGPLWMPVYVAIRARDRGVELRARAPLTRIVGRLTVLEDRLIDELEVDVPGPLESFARSRLERSHRAMLEALSS